MASETDAIDGAMLKGALESAEKTVEKHVEELNVLNVFPVPDGDTGTNMYLTLRATNKAIVSVDTSSVSAVSATAARGALLGARGNSGVILSQILSGFARGLDMKDRITSFEFAEAMLNARDAAYRAVANPVEGTILTVAREMSETARNMAERKASMQQTMKAVTAKARETVKKTPELLPSLKEAGVVDAGAKGLFYFMQGMHSFISNKTEKTGQRRCRAMKAVPAAGQYGFDLQFLVEGRVMPIASMRQAIEKMGESVLVVGDDRLLRVHIHTTDTDRVQTYARSFGELKDVTIEDLDRQVIRRQRSLVAARVLKKTAWASQE